MSESFKGWAIIELMGHRKLAGHVSEATIAGAAMLRLDVPSKPPLTQYYGGQAIYRITPTTEQLARQVAAAARPAPVSRYELPELAPPRTSRSFPSGEDHDDHAVGRGVREQDDAPDEPAGPPSCGGCGQPIAEGEAIADVGGEDGKREEWHERCAVADAQRSDDSIGDCW